MEETHAVTSVRLPRDMRQRYDELARLTGQTRNELIVAAMTRYLDEEMHEIMLIQEGLAQIEEGRHSAAEDVAARFVARGLLPSDWRDNLPGRDTA